MGRAALLLVQCLSDQQLLVVRKFPSRTPELNAIIRTSLGKISVLASTRNLHFPHYGSVLLENEFSTQVAGLLCNSKAICYEDIRQ